MAQGEAGALEATYSTILFLHPIVGQGSDKEEYNDGAEKREAARNPERPSVSPSGFCAPKCLDDRREHPSADESANLSDGGGGAVVLATDSSRASLTRKKTKAISGAFT
jgi:hypothetical protein